MRAKARFLTAVMTALAALILFSGTAMAADAAGKVDINTADKATLKTLNGIGDALAGRIIEYRQKHGPFKTPEDLQNVKGIGASTFKKNKSRIVAGKPAPVKEKADTPPKEAPKSQTKPKS